MIVDKLNIASALPLWGWNPNLVSVITLLLSNHVNRNWFKVEENNLQKQLTRVIPLEFLGSDASPFFSTGIIIDFAYIFRKKTWRQ